MGKIKRAISKLLEEVRLAHGITAMNINAYEQREEYNGLVGLCLEVRKCHERHVIERLEEILDTMKEEKT